MASSTPSVMDLAALKSLVDSAQTLDPAYTQHIVLLLGSEFAALSDLLEDTPEDPLHPASSISGKGRNVCIDVLATLACLVAFHMICTSPSNFIQAETEFLNSFAYWFSLCQSPERMETLKNHVMVCNCDMDPSPTRTMLKGLHLNKRRMSPEIAEQRFETFSTALFTMLWPLCNNVSISKMLRSTDEFMWQPGGEYDPVSGYVNRWEDGDFLLPEFLYGSTRDKWLTALLVWFLHTRSSSFILPIMVTQARYQDQKSPAMLAAAARNLPGLPRALVDSSLECFRVSQGAAMVSEKDLKDAVCMATIVKSIVVDLDLDYGLLDGLGREDAGHILIAVYDAVLAEARSPTSSSHTTLPVASPLPYLVAVAIHLYPAVKDVPNAEDMLKVLEQQDLVSLDMPCIHLWQCMRLIGEGSRSCVSLGCPKNTLVAKFSCAGCGIYRYCSKKCQQQDWREERRPHNKVCKKLKALRTAWLDNPDFQTSDHDSPPAAEKILGLENQLRVQTLVSSGTPSEQRLLGAAERVGITRCKVEEILHIIRPTLRSRAQRGESCQSYAA